MDLPKLEQESAENIIFEFPLFPFFLQLSILLSNAAYRLTYPSYRGFSMYTMMQACRETDMTIKL